MVRTSPVIKASVFALFLIFLLAGFAQNPTATVKESAKAARMRQLNNQILNLHAQMQTADVSMHKQLRGQAFQVLKARQAALVALMQENPKAALSLAFSQEALDELAVKFPESDVFLEERVQIMGEVEHWIADYPKGKSESIILMKSGEQPIRMYFAGPEPDLTKGDVVQATGVVTGSEMAVETATVLPDSTSVQVSSPDTKRNEFPLIVFSGVFLPFLGGRGPIRKLRRVANQIVVCTLVVLLVALGSTSSVAQNSCSTTGVQNVAVLLVYFPGTPLPSTVTTQSVQDMFFTGANGSLNGFWQETSSGVASAQGDVLGPYSLGGNYSSCNLVALSSDAIAAASAGGVNLQNYTRIVVVFPDVLGCGWSGFSSVGCSSVSTPDGTINASTSYVSAAYASVQVVTHELGHGLGLLHAAARGFTDSNGSPITLGPLGTAGTLTEYGDKFSAMSCCTGNLGGEYAAPHKAEILGWLPPSTGYQLVQSSGTYTIAPYETSGGLKALKVQRGTGNDSWLWIEYRQPDGGYDTPQSSGGAFPSPLNTFLAPQPYSGALIHYEDSTTGLRTHLINYAPSDSSFFSPALVAGQTWEDPYSNVSLSIQSAISGGLAVNVSYGAVACTHANPSISITPLDPSTYPGTSVAYGMSITNNDSSGCSAGTFTPSSSQPSGFSAAFSASSISLNPGQSGSLTMTQIPPAGTAPGTYPISASASNQSYVGTAAANLSVMNPPALTVTVSVPSSSYTRRNTVPIAATVLTGGSPVSKATVVFTLTTPTGTKVTQTSTTSVNGTVTWNYKLNMKAPIGTYFASAQASYSSSGSTQTATSNTVSFSVQ